MKTRRQFFLAGLGCFVGRLAASLLPAKKPGFWDEPFVPRTLCEATHLEHFFNLIPKGVEILKVGGQSLFPVYGVSGGMCASLLLYVYKGRPDEFDGYDLGTTPQLIKRKNGAYHPVVILYGDLYGQAYQKLQAACIAVRDA